MTDLAERWQKLWEVQVRLVSNTPHDQGWPVDALFLAGLSPEMVKCSLLFGVVATLYEEGVGLRVAFNGSDGEGWDGVKKIPTAPGTAWPGKQFYLENLRLFVPEEHLIPVGPGYHSRGEVDELLKSAREHGWKSVGLMSVAWHAVRQMICLIQAMKEQNYWIEAYTIPVLATDWNMVVVGSQGASQQTAWQEVAAEGRRIINYQDAGFGCSTEELVAYLDRRDAGLPLAG